MLRNIELFVGTNPGRTGRVSSALAEPLAIAALAAELRASAIQGATIIPGWGFWEGELERFFIIYLGGVEESEAENFASRIGETFGQDAIGWREAAPIALAWNKPEGREHLFKVAA